MSLVNLISYDNGVGLSRDVELLKAFFKSRDHTVRYHDWRAIDVLRDDDPVPFVGDLAVHVEVFDPKNLRLGDKNIGIFNLEWFETAWIEHLPKFDQLWTKSCAAFEWYQERHLDQARFTGFLARDMFDSRYFDSRYARTGGRRALHVRGKSRHKGTNEILAAYDLAPKRYPNFKMPPLTIVSHDEIGVSRDYLTVLRDVGDDKLRELMNTHRIHLCPSWVEGWGHYIAEALSCGAYVVTTDASPMNEHVMPSFGHLVPPSTFGHHHQAKLTVCAPGDILDGIVRAATPDEAVAERLEGVQARRHFETRNANFELKADRALQELGL